MKRHVALIGFMGSGKSTIGRRLARRLARAFFDTDEAVAAEHGPIARIFRDEGEAAFRRYERAALQRALGGGAAVVALGGGALTVEENSHALAGRAYRVLVDVSPARALERLRAGSHLRPLLGASPTLQRVERLYARRLPGYRSADYVVEADGLSVGECVEKIVAWLEERAPQ